VNPQDPLANLHPLREPELIGWWPPAPGWWMLLALVVVLLIAAMWLLLKRYRARLQEIYAAYEQDGDGRHCLQEVNTLLKTVALAAWPRRAVAATSGNRWLAFLNDACPKATAFPPEYADALYQQGEPELDLAALREAAGRWIARHEVTA
jgi:hypothetical protein